VTIATTLTQDIAELLCILCVVLMHRVAHGTFHQFIDTIRNHNHGASGRIGEHAAIDVFSSHFYLTEPLRKNASLTSGCQQPRPWNPTKALQGRGVMAAQRLHSNRSLNEHPIREICPKNR